MKCRQCGTEIADKALICYRCGTAVTEPTYKPADTRGARKSRLRTYIAIGFAGAAALFTALCASGVLS
jgi:hypothetical protein